MSFGGLAVVVLSMGCSAPRAEAHLVSAPRVGSTADLCERFAAVTDGLRDLDLSEPGAREAADARLRAAAELVPDEVAEALELERLELYREPGDPYDADLMWDVGVVVDGYAVETCGRSVFDPRVTSENPTKPRPETIPQSELPEEYLPDRPVLMTRAGSYQVSWAMPRPNLIDGPRPLKYIDAPATGTFWAYGGVGVEVRYDATLLTDLGHLGTTDEEIARAALTNLNGANPISLSGVEDHGTRTSIDWSQPHGDRVYFGTAWSFEGNVFAVSVAVPWDREDLADAAIQEMLSMSWSIRFDPL